MAKPIGNPAPKASENKGIPCPRCGEMLMPGATVCEVCGEVIIPTHPNKITATLPLTYNDEEEKPEPRVFAAPAVIPNVLPQEPKVEQPKKSGQVTVSMLVIICVLVALLAAVVTWAVIHFTRHSADNTEDVEQFDDEFANTDADITTGIDETAALPATQPAAPASEAKQPEVIDGDDVPIEGMRESLAGSWLFSGKINGKYSIGIDLKVEPDGTVSGSYWYDATLRQNGDVPSTYITLEGEVDDTGKVKLTAFKYGNNKPIEYWTGRFRGVTPLRLTGNFRNIATGNTYTYSAVTH